MAIDILTWWLAAQLLGAAGLPLAALLLRGLPDGGFAYAKALGLLLTGYLAWLLAMLGLAPFGAASLVASALAVAGLGLWLAGGPRAALAGAREAARDRWPALLASEAVFLAGLLATVWLRAHDPTPWGTERPMDFAFFNAIQRSGFFPPNDPWLAGFSINYYYFGYLLMAAVALLTGVAPAVAYNLSLALIVGLTAQGAAGTIANLLTLASARSAIALASRGRAARLAYAVFPLLAVIFVLVAGNQSGAVQVALGSERAVALDGGELLGALGQAAAGEPRISLPAPITTPPDAWQTFEGWERRDAAESFNWWWPSRSLWDEYAGGERERRYNITEFPFFSFRLGDMHPHVMALPFGLLAAAVALAALARPEAPGEGRSGTARLVLAGLVIGSLYALNSWDLPTYLLLFGAAATVATLRSGAPRPWLTLGRAMLIVVAAAYLLFLPFHLTFRSLVGAAAPLVDLPVLGRLTSVIAPYLDGRTGLHAFAIIFGLFFAPILAFVYLAAARDERPKTKDQGEQPVPTQAAAIAARTGQAGFGPSSLAFGLVWLPPLLLLGGLLVGFPLLALAGLGLLAAERATRLADRPAESFGLLAAALGCAVLFGTELIFIRDLFGNRMNTIFKFYYQVWLLWGTLAPFALWWCLRHAAGRARPVAWAAAVLTAALLAGALVYPWLTLRDMARGDMVGLDGRTPRELTAAGEGAAAWSRARAAPGSGGLGAPAVLNEAEVAGQGAAPQCGGSYNGEGFGGVSAVTGLPTLLGWEFHQRQWRGGDPAALDQLGPRCADADAIYRGGDPGQARELLRKYGVAYIYVGGLERQRYPAEALAKFAAIGDPVFEQDEVAIYRVR